MGSPSGIAVKNLPSVQETQETWFDPWVWKIPGRRKWQPTPIFLPGKSHGQRNPVVSSPWGHKRVRHELATEQQQWKKAPWVGLDMLVNDSVPKTWGWRVLESPKSNKEFISSLPLYPYPQPLKRQFRLLCKEGESQQGYICLEKDPKIIKRTLSPKIGAGLRDLKVSVRVPPLL